MKTIESTWTDQQGLEFYSKAWEPDGKPKAAVALLHGLGEHIGRYAHVGEAFALAGYALIGMDLRGHGHSGGLRGHTPSIEAYMQDIDLLLEHVRARYPSLPIFLYGHSLGAILALNYGLRRRPDFRGVIATSPALHSELEDQPVKVAVARALGALLPSVLLNGGLKTSGLSRDPQVEQLYVRDPLVHDKISLGFGKLMFENLRWTMAHAAEFPLPLLLMHGTADRIAFPSSSKEFAAAAGGKATLVLWKDLYHETHNELNKAEVIQTTIRWMDEHLE